MAVIESKGDGYSLFNGVKLPSLPIEVIKETHPNIMIYTNADGSVYSGIASTVPYKHFNAIDIGSGALLEALVANDGKRKPFSLVNGVWNIPNVSVSMFESYPVETITLVWSNFDILNEDGSVYFAASEPISLDGMNVIEWDGDTTGLAQFGTATFYRVASVANVDTTKGTIAVRITAHTAISQHTWSDSGEYYKVATARYVAKESETYPNVGIYIPKFTNGRVALFAYYPIETSDSDGEKTNIHFNNKDYSVNNSSLSTHSADLKSHLSTVMNGTGAVINLGGVAYNVDATKLAAAKSAFIQHLGTIAGSGHKVVIGGVEYGIDASKVAGAVAEIEAVLGGAISGGGEEPAGFPISWNTMDVMNNTAAYDENGSPIYVKISDFVPDEDIMEQVYLMATAPLSTFAEKLYASENIVLYGYASTDGSGNSLFIAIVSSPCEDIGCTFPEAGLYAMNVNVIYGLNCDVVIDFAETITFTIDGVEYKALEGMTWYDWCNSELNTGDWEANISGGGVVTEDLLVKHPEGAEVDKYELIIADTNYQVEGRPQ